MSASVPLAHLHGFVLSGCDLVTRCTVALSALALTGAPGASKPSAPPSMPFDLFGNVEGSWFKLASYSWAPVGWEAPGVLCWSGPLVQGFALRGRVREEVGNDARALTLSVTWLVDRSGSDKGASGGPLVTVV